MKADKKGSEYCIMGLTQMLLIQKDMVFRGGGDLNLKGTELHISRFIRLGKVKKICDTYEADPIVLSTFDSDSRTFEGKKIVKTKTVKKEAKIKEVKYPVTLVMEIESGWRIYDVTTKKIVDVNKFTEVKEYVEWGSSYDESDKSPSKRQALKSSGMFAGEQYGFRITPVWVKQNRLYFIGKSEELKLAKNYVKREIGIRL